MRVRGPHILLASPGRRVRVPFSPGRQGWGPTLLLTHWSPAERVRGVG